MGVLRDGRYSAMNNDMGNRVCTACPAGMLTMATPTPGTLCKRARLKAGGILCEEPSESKIVRKFVVIDAYYSCSAVTSFFLLLPPIEPNWVAGPGHGSERVPVRAGALRGPGGRLPALPGWVVRGYRRHARVYAASKALRSPMLGIVESTSFGVE